MIHCRYKTFQLSDKGEFHDKCMLYIFSYISSPKSLTFFIKTFGKIIYIYTNIFFNGINYVIHRVFVISLILNIHKNLKKNSHSSDNSENIFT